MLFALGNPFRVFNPLVHTVRHYNVRKFGRDLVAGLTVSVVEVPQAMAYALIAGVPPQYGLYTSIIQGVIGAMLSSSEHLTTGPTNTQSLLIAATVHRLVAAPGDPMYLELVFCLTLLKGLIQLVFAAARMGNMTRYVSRSVIAGVAAGAGVLILVGQLPNFLGITLPDEAARLPGAAGQLERVLKHVSETNMLSLGVGIAGLAVALLAPRIWRFLPGALLAVIAGAVWVWVAGWTGGDLALVGELPKSFPEWHVPALTWSRAESLFTGALALAIMGMLESVAIVKAIAGQSGERVNANQEFFAQGFKNAVSSFFQCIPGSGSFTRSALDYAAGAQTRFAAVFNACFVAVIYWFAAAQAAFIPMASLAAVLFVIAGSLIDWRYLIRVWKADRSDAVVCLITFSATLTLPLQYAIFVGIFLNLALFLRQAGQLHVAEMAPTSAGVFIERPLQEKSGKRSVMFLQIEGDLFFAVADELQERLSQLVRRHRIVIFRLKRTHSIDATVLQVFEQFARQMKERGGHVILCGLKPELMDTMRSFGLTKTIGEDNIFEAGFGVFTSAKKALERAKKLIGGSIDTDPIPDLDETEGWAYEI